MKRMKVNICLQDRSTTTSQSFDGSPLLRQQQGNQRQSKETFKSSHENATNRSFHIETISNLSREQ